MECMIHVLIMLIIKYHKNLYKWPHHLHNIVSVSHSVLQVETKMLAKLTHYALTFKYDYKI